MRATFLTPPLPHNAVSTDTSKFNSALLAVAAAAPVLVALFGLLLGLGLAPVTAWFWPRPTTNVAEAAALGDMARVRMLAARGERLDVVLPIDPRFLEDDSPRAMAPLEAAVRRRSDSLVAVLLELGVKPTSAEAQRLYCLAMAAETRDVATLLHDAFHVPADSCSAPPQPQ